MHRKFHGDICLPENVPPATKNINAKFPNEKIIKSTVEGDFDLPILPEIAQQPYIFSNINHSLVYIGALCDS